MTRKALAMIKAMADADKKGDDDEEEDASDSAETESDKVCHASSWRMLSARGLLDVLLGMTFLVHGSAEFRRRG